MKIASIGEMKDGELKMVKAGEREVLLAKVGQTYYAAEGRCPHMKGDLSRGTLSGTVITCPLHGSRFDLRDGSVVQWTNFGGLRRKLAVLFRSPRPLRIYPVRVEGDEILVDLD